MKVNKQFIFRIMRLSFIQLLLFVGFINLSISAPLKGQDLLEKKVSVALKDVSLEYAIKELEKEGNVRFSYNSRSIDFSRKINLISQNESLKITLEKLLKPLNIEFIQVDNQIVLRLKQIPTNPKETTNSTTKVMEVNSNNQVTETVSGKVLDENGEPLPGATVRLVGTTIGVTTDIDGNFKIDAKSGDILEISFVGFLKQTITIGNETLLSIRLKNDFQDLNEVIVIGYGSVKKSDLTGSVSSIKASDINLGANSSVDQMMIGRAAGVQISQSSSEPGGGLSIRIRGASSINASNEPLYVIDGFPIDNSSNLSGSSTYGDDNSLGSGVASTGSNLSPKNPLNTLNPNDIESIEILKDASATAIYGSRGANGVILITTKKGLKNKMTVNYGTYYGTQNVAQTLQVLDGAQYIKFINDVAADEGQSATYSAIGPAVDWQKEVYRSAIIKDHNISISGGIGNSSIFASLDYFNQDGVVKNTGTEKFIGRINFNTELSKKFTMAFNVNTSYIKDQNGLDGINTNESAGPIYSSLLYDPTELKYNSDGTYAESGNLTINNPLSLIYGVFNNMETNRTMVNFNTIYKPIEGLNFKVNLGSDRQTNRRNVYNSTLTRRGGPIGGQADITNLDKSNYLIELTADYSKTFGKHALNFLVGYTYQKFDLFLFSGNISGFPTDNLQTNNLGLGDTNNDNLRSDKQDNTLLSYLGRFNYTFNDKILLTGSIRADGSSRFGANNKYGYFPSFAIGYKLTEEDWFPKVFNEFKLRGSWGQTGNQEIPNYASQLTFGQGPYVAFNNVVAGSLNPSRIANPDLKWETTTQTNIGLDLSIQNGRISSTIDYFKKNTTDLLFNLPLPSASGFSSILSNVGSVENSGWEFLINTVNVSSKNFSWNSNLNLSAIKNNVTDLGRISSIVTGNIQAVGNTSIIQVGKPLASYYGFIVDGIQQAEDKNPGWPNFKDLNGDGAINAADQTIIGNPFPKLVWGLNNTLSYKNFSLSVFFQGRQGGDLLNVNVIESMYPSNFRRNRLAVMALDRWTPSNTDARWPSFANTNSYPGGKVNSLTLQDATYIRLKNLQINYNVPLRNNKYIKSLKLYVSGQNLWTKTNYIGFDPEANSLGRSNVKVDYSSYPLAKVYTMGLNVKF